MTKNMKWTTVCVEGAILKPLSSFISTNVERDQDGAFRIPSRFLHQFEQKLPYHLHIKCNTLIWKAIYDKERKKICGLYDFMRFYKLKMYSVVVFDYFGAGYFDVNCYNHTATSIVYPTIDPVVFFKNEKSTHSRMDEFIYGCNCLEVEKYISIIAYNAIRNNPEEFKIEVSGLENSEEMQHLVLRKELHNLYKYWEGMAKIFLTLALMEWEVELHWVDDTCKFGRGWYKFVKELDLSNGDVIFMHIIDSPHIVNTCILKKEDVSFEKEAGKKNGRSSFYKILYPEVIEDGYVVLPTLVGEDTEKMLCGSQKIIIDGIAWNIRYHEKLRMIYALDELIEHFGLMVYDTIHFRLGLDGVLSARIYKMDGMKIIYSRPERTSRNRKCDDFFLFEESCEDTDLEMEEVNARDDDPVTNAGNNIDNVIEIAENNLLYQFSERLIACHFDNKCHGVHIPRNIKFQNRDWNRGDCAKVRKTDGSWDPGIVLNNGKARFSAGWSKFVREQKLKKNDNLRFTLHEDDDIAVFDIEVNPIN